MKSPCGWDLNLNNPLFRGDFAIISRAKGSDIMASEAKKLALLRILEILQRNTDEAHPLTHNQNHRFNRWFWFAYRSFVEFESHGLRPFEHASRYAKATIRIWTCKATNTRLTRIAKWDPFHLYGWRILRHFACPSAKTTDNPFLSI